MNQLPTVGHTFLKLTRNLLGAALALALGLALGSTKVQAQTTDTWIVNSGTFNVAGNWDTAQIPATNDKTLFTNETSITVNLSANTGILDRTTISNHTGVVTINCSNSLNNGVVWYVTNRFAIGVCDSTSTVYMAGGTLTVAYTNGLPSGQLRIGDAITNVPNFNCVGSLIVTAGTVRADAGIVGASSNSVGTLVISGNGVYRDGGVNNGSTLTVGANGSSCQLIITNGGKLFVDGTLTVGNSYVSSNDFMLLSGPTSAATLTQSGDLKFSGNGGQLIISNGAKLFQSGSLLFGGSCNASTGVVVGAGTSVNIGGSFQVGLGGAGSTNTLFTVSDGASISVGGTFAMGNNSFNISNGFVMGGSGLMSTGLFNVMRSNSTATNHDSNFITFTNSFATASYLNPQGPIETISVLNKATLIMTNSYLNVTAGSGTNNISMGGPNGLLLINNGTLLAPRTSDNGGGMSYGGAGGSLIITNGGYLLTSSGTLGAGSPFCTGIVVGASSVWSNHTTVADSTNLIIVGTGGGATNFLGVFDGAKLYNNGSLNIGNNVTSVFNTVTFGGPGAAVTVFNGGSLNIGSASNVSANVLNITNATVSTAYLNVGNSFALSNSLVFKSGTFSVGSMRVRPTNTVTFSGGVLSVGSNTVDTLADNNGPFVVGDGTTASAAVYEMAAGGTGYHNFNNGGLVVTNNATLRGSGTLAGNATVLGTFSPGIAAVNAGVGSIFASNDLVFGSSAVLNYNLGTAQDSVIVNGNLTLGGTINVTSNAGFTATTYTLLTHTNLVFGPAGTLSVGTMPTGYTATVSTNTLPLVQLIVTPIGGGGDPYTSWQTLYFSGSTLSSAGNADPLGKGMSNTNQFLAGFNPTNAAAYLHITAISKTNGGTDVRVDYLGASGDNTYTGGPTSRTNVLEFTTGAGGNYNSNSFVSTGVINILSGGTGLGTLTNMVDPGGAIAGATRYYRVRVLVP